MQEAEKLVEMEVGARNKEKNRIGEEERKKNNNLKQK